VLLLMLPAKTWLVLLKGQVKTRPEPRTVACEFVKPPSVILTHIWCLITLAVSLNM